MIVSGSQAGADETYAHLSGPLRRPSRAVVGSGFTSLIHNLDKMEEFLS